MDRSKSSIQSLGDSSRDLSTNEKREKDEAATRPKQESLCKRGSCKSSKQHRHMPYDRSPGGSTCTSSDESNGEQEQDVTGAGGGRKVQKRIDANSRERKRMHTVNSAFDELRELVPTYPTNRKLSKIDTLRLACAYIEDLTSLLRSPAVHVMPSDDVKLYPSVCPEGFVQGPGSGCGSPTASSYPGIQVKNELGTNGDYSGCSYQHYRVHPSYFSDCSDYSASEPENHSPPHFAQNCMPGIGVRPPAFSRTSSDSAVALQMAQTSIGTSVSGQVYHHPRALPPNCSPLATVQHTLPPLLATNIPSPPQNHSPPVWQRSGSLPYCLYGQ